MEKTIERHLYESLVEMLDISDRLPGCVDPKCCVCDGYRAVKGRANDAITKFKHERKIMVNNMNKRNARQVAIGVTIDQGVLVKQIVCVDEYGNVFQLVGKKWEKLPDLPEEVREK